MNTKNFEIVIKTGIPKEFEEQIFEIEKSTFEKVYKRCPKTIDEFRQRYKGKDIRIIICTDKKLVLGFRIFEIINKEQVQSMFMVVRPEFRGLKISNLICSVSYDYLRWNNFKFIGSWTHTDITASKILAKYSPYVSTNEKLNQIEIQVLNNFELSIGKEKGYFGNNRKVLNFYNMLDNREGHAFFWVHKI